MGRWLYHCILSGMKIIARVLLIILAFPIFVLCALSINVRFQFLSPVFWTSTFEKGTVYSRISESMKSRLIQNVVAEGGKESDVASLSNLISANGLKVFAEENITSILAYANGKSPEVIVYVPAATKDFSEVSTQGSLQDLLQKMPLSDFLKDFNISGINPSDLILISKFGMFSWLLFAVSLVLLFLLLLAAYGVTDSGKRLVTPGIVLLLPGLLVLAASFAADFASDVLNINFAASSNIGASLVAIIAPPVIRGMAIFWLWFGALSVLLGISLFFIKKQGLKKATNHGTR
jgi:hypothetical protein